MFGPPNRVTQNHLKMGMFTVYSNWPIGKRTVKVFPAELPRKLSLQRHTLIVALIHYSIWPKL